ncbi:unnamed protein product [Brachionus calyciflorus]|uniref:FLYWCH-type domain-containing protein n=1 Tax=Brachionus calyciflorus TaxID=104777 RepID=A0A813VCK0_9BILA|nr:unnamed protein product [Brachionus calyciflorus]
MEIKYIPNNRFNLKLSIQDNTNHDGHDLCYNDLLFKRQRITKKSINWQCKVVKCSGSVILQITSYEIQHFVQYELVSLHKPFNDIEQVSNQFSEA